MVAIHKYPSLINLFHNSVLPQVGDKKMQEDQAKEQRIRRLLKKDDLILRKSRYRNQELKLYHGGYMVVDFNNCIVAGEGYTFSLDDVERWIN